MVEVIQALDSLEQEFKANPYLFFTENDLHSRLYHLVQERLCYQRVNAADSTIHYLVHHEYPTPFRCDMIGHGFRVANDDERAPSGGKYIRGHYDLVVFNPDFISRASLEVIRGQSYGTLLHQLPGLIASLREPSIMAGVEIIYRRSEFASSTDVDRWCDIVRQDHMKLQASRTWMGLPFMDWTMTIAANAVGARGSAAQIIKKRLSTPGIEYWEP